MKRAIAALRVVSSSSSSRTRTTTNLNMRSYASLSDHALRMFTGHLRQDLENNPDLWVSASAVNEPTVSILDPSPGYYRKASPPLSEDFDKSPVNGIMGADVVPNALYTSKNLPDPFDLIRSDLATLNEGIRRVLGMDHPVLSAVAEYFFAQADGGKKVRPAMILLLARAADAHRDQTPELAKPPQHQMEFILGLQKRLAEITEMMHTATLLHDDVIDRAATRRGVPAANKKFGDKMAILAGDFLLARSAICLARLRSLEAVELISTALEHLVKGEVMQMRHFQDPNSPVSALEYYLRKNYYKTGSLMANSCKVPSICVFAPWTMDHGPLTIELQPYSQAGLVLGMHDEHIVDLGFAYGRHIGLAFQLIDDVLDYQGTHSGKPLLTDLKSGLSTAPLLLAKEEFPELEIMASRKFSEPNDIERASELVSKSAGIERTKRLAISQAELACQAVMQLQPSPHRDALIRLAQLVISRSK